MGLLLRQRAEGQLHLHGSGRSRDRPGEIVVGLALERTRGLSAGNGISFRAYSGELHTFIVAAVLAHESELVSADLVLMNEADFRRFFAHPDGYQHRHRVVGGQPARGAHVGVKLLMARPPDLRLILREDEVLRTHASIFDWREGMMLALSAAILAFAASSPGRLSSVGGKKNARSASLAIGWETGDVIAMKFWEGFLVSLLPSWSAGVAAYVHAFHFEFTLFAPVLEGGGAVPEFRAHAADRRPAGGHAVRVHRAATHGHPGADLARGDHRPRHRDAELTRCRNSPTSARCSTRASTTNTGRLQGHRPGDPAGAGERAKAPGLAQDHHAADHPRLPGRPTEGRAPGTARTSPACLSAS